MKPSDIRWRWLEEKGFNVVADRHQYAYMQSLWSPLDIVQGVFCEAKAGCGKTALAVLAGVYEVEKGTYDRIIYVRNTIPVRDQGFLPGSPAEKDLPYMAPLIEAMDGIQPGLYDKWSRPNPLKHEPPKVLTKSTAFTRGVTWDRSFIIIDEAQSFDLDELQTVYTRVTDSCKIVTTGSLRQNDNRKQRKYGGLIPLEVYMRHFEGKRVTFHKLEINYRGDFANHADDVMDTVALLEAKPAKG